MGTSHSYAASPQEQGILPRVIGKIFSEMEARKEQSEFSVRASFLEIYNEQIIDLLDFANRATKAKAAGPSIIEEAGNISIVGLTEEAVTNETDLMTILERGSLQRSTSSTLMNDQSSRSHAIFTITIKQEVLGTEGEKGSISAKFHFVDLAGSERIKKTGATGSTLREGISINLGLLCLGNVINALTNPETHFIPYRDSKLTRILQDSLGGNSNTYMIACVSPAESNFEETLSTLKYAARAMNIKNKPVINRDPMSALVAQLKQKLAESFNENTRLRGMLKEAGIKVEEPPPRDEPSQGHIDFMGADEREELHRLRSQIIGLEKKVELQSLDLTRDRKRINDLEIETLEMKRDRDLMRLRLEEIRKDHPGLVFSELSEQTSSTLDGYLQQLEEVKAQLSDKDRQCESAQHSYEVLKAKTEHDEQIMLTQTKEIYKLKKEIVEVYTNRKIDKVVDDKPQEAEPAELPDETIFEDGEFKEKETEFDRQVQEGQQELSLMSRAIGEKEQELREMTNAQIELEYRLISEMKEEYHHKIRQLEKEKEKLEKDMAKHKEEGTNRSVNVTERERATTQLRAKREAVDSQLKEYKKRERDQQNLEKLVESQKQRINSLSTEIRGFKQQKQELTRRLKEDKEKFEKFKTDRIKEMLQLKRKAIERDYEMRKLTFENKKVLMNMQKKEEEAKRLKKANDTLREILEPKRHAKPTFSRHTVQANPDTSILSTDGVNFDQVANRALTRLACQLEIETDTLRCEREIESSNIELIRYLERQAKAKVELERALAHEVQDEAKVQELRGKLTEIDQLVETLEENLQYSQDKLKAVTQGQGRFDPETELIYSKQYDNIESQRKLLRVFLQRLQAVLREQMRERENSAQLALEIEKLRQGFEEKEQQLILLSTQYQENLTRLREEAFMRAVGAEESMEQQTQQRYLNLSRTGAEKTDQKYYERKVQDLNKKVKQLTLDLEQSKRKYDVVAQKYENAKKLTTRDRFVGRMREDEESSRIMSYKEKRLERSTRNEASVLAQSTIDDVMHMASTDEISIIKPEKRNTEQDEQLEDLEESFMSRYHWECHARLEGHQSPILALACHSNMLISTSTKSLKLWDLETNKVISDLAGMHLNGFVRCVSVEPEK